MQGRWRGVGAGGAEAWGAEGRGLPAIASPSNKKLTARRRTKGFKAGLAEVDKLGRSNWRGAEDLGSESLVAGRLAGRQRKEGTLLFVLFCFCFGLLREGRGGKGRGRASGQRGAWR